MRRGGSDGSEGLRSRLIDAALGILEEPDTPLELRKVAEAAGKSRTAPYLVFGKESEGGGLAALRMAVAAEGADMLARRMDKARASTDDARLALHRVARALFSFATEKERLFRLMFGPEIGTIPLRGGGEARRHPELQRLVDARTRVERVVERVVRQGQDERILPADDPLRRTMGAWALLIGIAFLLLDRVLEAAGVHTSVDEGADLATGMLVGAPPDALTGAALALLSARMAKAGQGAKGELLAKADHGDRADDDARVEEDVGGVPYGSEPMTELWDLAAPTPSAPRGVWEKKAAWLGADEPHVRASRVISSHPSLRRAALVGPALRGAKILWIDDRPEGNVWERQVLEELGIVVTAARSTKTALDRLAEERFDLVISDIERNGDPAAGVEALPSLRRAAPGIPVIFYIARLDPAKGTPEGAAGITNRVDELLHLVLDVLERRRL